MTVPHRARVTAAIHAFAEYLAEHPEIPTPTNLMSIAHLSERDEADEATRVAAVMSFCKGQDLEFKERHDFVTSAFQVVMHERTHGVRITHSVMTPIVPIVPVGHYVP